MQPGHPSTLRPPDWSYFLLLLSLFFLLLTHHLLPPVIHLSPWVCQLPCGHAHTHTHTGLYRVSYRVWGEDAAQSPSGVHACPGAAAGTAGTGLELLNDAHPIHKS